MMTKNTNQQGLKVNCYTYRVVKFYYKETVTIISSINNHIYSFSIWFSFGFDHFSKNFVYLHAVVCDAVTSAALKYSKMKRKRKNCELTGFENQELKQRVGQQIEFHSGAKFIKHHKNVLDLWCISSWIQYYLLSINKRKRSIAIHSLRCLR